MFPGIATVPSTLDDELLTNPFLRCDKNSVISSAETRAGKALDTIDAVFAEVREWKNTF